MNVNPSIKRVLPAAIFVVAAVLAFLMISSKPQLVARQGEAPPPLVSAQTVTFGEVPVEVIAHGNVTASRALDLVAEVTGRVIDVSPDFEPGVVVSEGQMLLRVDDTDYQFALADAKQELASANLSLADARALKRTAAIAQSEARVDAAKKRIARAERDLANTTIKAPYTAVIDQQSAELGQFIATGTRVARILGAERAEIRLPIVPSEIGFVRAQIGQQTHRWTGTVSRVEARVDDQTRVFPVVIEIENPLDEKVHGAPLSFGLFVEAKLSGGIVADAVRLPRSALHGGDTVYVVEEGALRPRQVDIARVDSEGIIVTEGLREGDKVVTTRLDLMFNGMQVDLYHE
ncbi:MAG: efflux RND transporter periplasmic adaptor subunit [bacterium]